MTRSIKVEQEMHRRYPKFWQTWDFQYRPILVLLVSTCIRNSMQISLLTTEIWPKIPILNDTRRHLALSGSCILGHSYPVMVIIYLHIKFEAIIFIDDRDIAKLDDGRRHLEFSKSGILGHSDLMCSMSIRVPNLKQICSLTAEMWPKIPI